MTTFPTIQSPNGLQQKTIKPAQRSTSSAGYTMARAKATIAKKEFKVMYQNLTTAERNTLQTFFNSNQGLEFDWTHPEPSGSTYQVIFNQDDIEFVWISFGLWTVTFKIKEV